MIPHFVKTVFCFLFSVGLYLFAWPLGSSLRFQYWKTGAYMGLPHHDADGGWHPPG